MSSPSGARKLRCRTARDQGSEQDGGRAPCLSLTTARLNSRVNQNPPSARPNGYLDVPAIGIRSSTMNKIEWHPALVVCGNATCSSRGSRFDTGACCGITYLCSSFVNRETWFYISLEVWILFCPHSTYPLHQLLDTTTSAVATSPYTSEELQSILKRSTP